MKFPESQRFPLIIASLPSPQTKNRNEEGMCYQRSRRVRRKGLGKKYTTSRSGRKCMRHHCVCSRVIPLAYSFKKHRTVLQVTNSHNSSSFSSRVAGSSEFTIWHLVEVQREDPWNKLDDTLPMGHLHASHSKGRGHWQWCHFCTDWRRRCYWPWDELNWN